MSQWWQERYGLVIRIAGNQYNADARQTREILELASQRVKEGIYAIEFNDKGVIRILNEPIVNDVKRYRKDAGKRGIKVYVK